MMLKPVRARKPGGPKTALAGDKYVGAFKNNKQNGQGTYTYADGSIYVGDFMDDVKTGQGTKTWGPQDGISGR